MNLLASFFLLLWAGINYEGAILADARTDMRSLAAYEWTALAGPDIEGKWIEWDRHTLLVVAYGKQSQVSSLWPREYGILRHDKKQGGVYFYLGHNVNDWCTPSTRVYRRWLLRFIRHCKDGGQTHDKRV